MASDCLSSVLRGTGTSLWWGRCLPVQPANPSVSPPSCRIRLCEDREPATTEDHPADTPFGAFQLPRRLRNEPTVAEELYATLDTSKGPIRIHLFQNHAPKT